MQFDRSKIPYHIITSRIIASCETGNAKEGKDVYKRQDGVVDAVVRDASLRIVVGAYLGGAVASTDPVSYTHLIGDGKEVTPSVMSALNPDKIERVTVLKDKSATSKTEVPFNCLRPSAGTYFTSAGFVVSHLSLIHIYYTIYNLAAFMEGDIQDCIDHLIVAENAERLKESEL